MSLLTDALEIANGVTQTLELQINVTFRRYLGADSYGAESYATPVLLPAVVEYKQRSVKSQSGELVMSTTTLTFLDLAQLVAATPAVIDGSGNPTSAAGVVSVHDDITLPDGSNQPILNVGGFFDGGSGQLIPTEIYLG